MYSVVRPGKVVCSDALRCAARDQWIGWNFRHQYDRLHLITNNSRFLILPDWHYPNFATRILSLCQRRLASDWQRKFNHPLLLLETFVDPSKFSGTIYKAANWRLTGHSKGFQRTREGYSKTMRGTIGEDGRQTHIMSAIGHHTQDCYAQKKLASSR